MGQVGLARPDAGRALLLPVPGVKVPDDKSATPCCRPCVSAPITRQKRSLDMQNRVLVTLLAALSAALGSPAAAQPFGGRLATPSMPAPAPDRTIDYGNDPMQKVDV